MSTPDMHTQKIEKIVSYWNSKLLCSPESSTSHTDPNLASLDNTIENRVLREILQSWKRKNIKRCLDVGAGYGRFVRAFQEFYSEIVLLEAAERIFSQLRSIWQNNENIKCRLGTFESVDDMPEYDLIFASGILYLYDDEMACRFLEKSRTMLFKEGLLVIRDFISEPQRIIKSSYVEDGFCYYRSPQFWHDSAKSRGFDILQVRRSKPRLAFLRNSRILQVLRWLHLTGWLKHPRAADVAIKFGDWQLAGDEVLTVFLVMRAR